MSDDTLTKGTTMPVETPVEAPTSRSTTSGAIDCDVHPNLKVGLADLVPFLDEAWVKRMGIGRRAEWTKHIPGMEVTIPMGHWINPAGSQRLDATPPGGGAPGSDPHFVVEDLLDRYDYAAAVLNGNGSIAIGGFADADLAAAVAAAHNNWLSEVWLSVDPRFKGTITVGPRDAALAVQEIERWANDKRMVQVFIPYMDKVAMGDRHFYPIYEAAQHHGFPIVVHPGGEGAGINASMMAVAEPTYYFEYHTSLSQIPQAQLISMIGHGVFERFPDLKLIISEGGFAWLIEVLWRLDQKWRAVRQDVPWVKRLPTEYFREHVRLTSQPLYEPDEREHLHQVLEMVYADETLLFSSDYPHWDTDAPDKALSAVPRETLDHMMRRNPQLVYGL